MSEEKFVYVQNTHNVPISANARDSDKRVLFTKKFMPMLTDKWTGKVLHTGYEKLTEEEYEQLKAGSRTFQHYSKDLKYLVVHDEVPADLKTPHEALVDARKEAKKAAVKIAKLDAEIVELKARLLDAETKYGQLSSASGGAGKSAAKIAELEKALALEDAANNADQAKIAELTGALEEAQGSLISSVEAGKALLEAVLPFGPGNEELAKAVAAYNDASKALT